MVFDSKLKGLQERFGIQQVQDWESVRPGEILAVDGVGPGTLDHLRLYLSTHDVALCDDGTAEVWAKKLNHISIAQTISPQDVVKVAPFTILIDTAEQHPFEFRNMTDRSGNAIEVPTRSEPLGRSDFSLGDYSISGFRGEVHVERKSADDLRSTILGWRDGRRERFEHELHNLSLIAAAAVIVESEMSEVLKKPLPNSSKSNQTNGKILFRTILSFKQKYPTVAWLFMPSRRSAEVACYRWFETFYRHNSREAREAEQLLGQL